MEEPKPETMEETPAPAPGDKPEEAKPEMVEEAPQEPQVPRRDDNTVFIGKKGTMGYVLAVVTQFNNGAKEVTVKARGKLISRAVDVVEIVRHRFLPDAKVDDISIATEELTSEDGSKSKVSSIEVRIIK